jgi:hypothetical protein
MNSSAQAKTTHQAIEIARSQMSRVMDLKQRPLVNGLKSVGRYLGGIHRKVNFWRTAPLIYRGETLLRRLKLALKPASDFAGRERIKTLALKVVAGSQYEAHQ